MSGGMKLYKPPGAKCAMPISQDVTIQDLAEKHLEVVANDSYDGDDPEFRGKTRLEATILSLAKDATHDPKARTEFLDRIMGKARQRIDQTSVNISLTGMLDQLAQMEEDVIDVTPDEDDGMEMFK